MRPRNPQRNVSMGMNAPSGDYDSGTIAQMQAAIEDLARQLQSLRNAMDGGQRAAEKRLSDNVEQVASGQRWGEREEAVEVVSGDGAELGSSTPEAVAPRAGSPGVSDRAARQDHVHTGQPYQTLENAVNATGTFAYSGDRVYANTGGSWLCITHVVEA